MVHCFTTRGVQNSKYQKNSQKNHRAWRVSGGNWWSTQAVTNSPPPHTDRGQYWASIYSNPAQDLIAIREKNVLIFPLWRSCLSAPLKHLFVPVDQHWDSPPPHSKPHRIRRNSETLWFEVFPWGFSWLFISRPLPPPYLKLDWKASWCNSEAFWGGFWRFWVEVSWTWAMT